MRIIKGKIVLGELHFERLMSSLHVLRISVPKLVTPGFLENEILELCRKNGCTEKSRVRLSVSRGDGGLYDSDDRFQYLIECRPLNVPADKLNENGLVIDVFPDALKAVDRFSNLKSANYLPYTMAALWAKENRLNDCLVLNTHGRICDATIANVFWVKQDTLFTPPLSEGCVAGVMRRWLLEGRWGMADLKIKPEEQPAATGDLLNADEIFLTNAVSGIRWVKQFREKKYTNRIAREIFRKMVQTILL